jgi:hypothetical protein
MPKDAWQSTVAESSCPYLHLHHVRPSKNCVHILRSVERCSGELVQKCCFRRGVACDTTRTGDRRSVYRCSHRFEVGAHRLCDVRLWILRGRSLLKLRITLGLISAGITLTCNEGCWPQPQISVTKRVRLGRCILNSRAASALTRSVEESLRMPLIEVAPDETLMKQGQLVTSSNGRHLQRMAAFRAQDHIFNFHPNALRIPQSLCLVSVLFHAPHTGYTSCCSPWSSALSQLLYSTKGLPRFETGRKTLRSRRAQACPLS